MKGLLSRTPCLIRVQGRAVLLTEDDVDNLTLVLFHVIQQVFFAGRLETTNTATEEQNAVLHPGRRRARGLF